MIREGNFKISKFYSQFQKPGGNNVRIANTHRSKNCYFLIFARFVLFKVFRTAFSIRFEGITFLKVIMSDSDKPARVHLNVPESGRKLIPVIHVMSWRGEKHRLRIFNS